MEFRPGWLPMNFRSAACPGKAAEFIRMEKPAAKQPAERFPLHCKRESAWLICRLTGASRERGWRRTSMANAFPPWSSRCRSIKNKGKETSMRRYTKSHEWVRPEGKIAYVGISDHAQKEVTDVVYVEV